MNVADLTGMALDYWVARSLHDFVREIHFTDSGETVSIRGNDRGRPWDGRFTPSTSWEAACGRAGARAAAGGARAREPSGGRIASQTSKAATGRWKGGATRCGSRCCGRLSTSRFGDTVDDVLRQAQALAGLRAEPIGEETAGDSLWKTCRLPTDRSAIFSRRRDEQRVHVQPTGADGHR